MIDPKQIEAIQALKAKGYNIVRTARELGISRNTVTNYWGEAVTRRERSHEEVALQRALSKGTDHGLVRRLAAGMIERFIYTPNRIKVILARFYDQALRDNRVLAKYMDILVPAQEISMGVTVQINTPILAPTNKKFGINGEAIEDAEIVEDSRAIPEVERSPNVTA